MTHKEILARKCVIADIMDNQNISLPKAIEILREWETAGLILFTPTGKFALLKN